MSPVGKTHWKYFLGKGYYIAVDRQSPKIVSCRRPTHTVYKDICDCEPFELPTSIMEIVFEILGKVELPWQH